MPISLMITKSLELLFGLIKIAKATKELSYKDFQTLKEKIDKEFDNIPEWDDL